MKQNKQVEENFIKILTDEASYKHKILDFETHSKVLAEIIENSTPRFTIGIFGDWGTGKTTLMKMIMQELKPNKKILPVWFDAWRYEREEYLAVIPFLRTVNISLQNFINIYETEEKSKWSRLRNALDQTFKAFFSSTTITYGIKDVVSLQTDLNTLTAPLISTEPIEKGVNVVYYHATDFLEHALDDIRQGNNENKGYRIVVFIDDLDRCTPEKGLEVLESIKSFFDIEGIIYVLGMNHTTINSLVRKKFESNPNITGLEYMKKIVQLPFHIPEWSESDIYTLVEYTISKELGDSERLKKVFGESFIVIIQAIEANPREAKRFINSIILSQAVFSYLPLEDLIIVQALKFREEWNKFLDFITESTRRTQFFKLYSDFVKFAQKSSMSIESISKGLEAFYQGDIEMREFEGSSLFKEINNDVFEQYYLTAKQILQLYPKMEKDYHNFLLLRNPLNRFLSTTYRNEPVMNKLIKIANFEVFRRAISTTSDKPDFRGNSSAFD